METQTVPPEIIDFYTSEYDEASRLSARAHGLLEMIRTQELLRRYLPAAPASVLDVGGGPGAHARWLVADGYPVHLIDPVQLHLEQASAACACTTELGDARHLRARDASHDVALLLGPLYHLPEHADRLQALREARRVVRPGGLVAVAAISRHSTVLDLLATARLAGAGEQSLRSVLETGRHDPSLGFTTAYFHTAEELVSEMTVAGLTDVTLHGVEGPGWASLLAIQTHTGHVPAADAPLMTSAVSAARLTESDPALVASSAHFLAFGRA